MSDTQKVFQEELWYQVFGRMQRFIDSYVHPYIEGIKPARESKVGRPKGADVATRNTIVSTLAEGARKFGELQQSTGINKGILSKHLELLMEEGAVKRKVLPIKGHFVEYSLIGAPFDVEEWIIEFETATKARPYQRYLVPTKEELEDFAKTKAKRSRLIEKTDYPSLSSDFRPKYKLKRNAMKQVRKFYNGRMTELGLVDVDLPSIWVANYLFHNNLKQGRVCIDCLAEDKFSVMMAEPGDSDMIACPNCGVTIRAQPELTEEKKLIVRGAMGPQVKQKIEKMVRQWKMELGGHPMDEQRILKMVRSQTSFKP